MGEGHGYGWDPVHVEKTWISGWSSPCPLQSVPHTAARGTLWSLYIKVIPLFWAKPSKGFLSSLELNFNPLPLPYSIVCSPQMLLLWPPLFTFPLPAICIPDTDLFAAPWGPWHLLFPLPAEVFVQISNIHMAGSFTLFWPLLKSVSSKRPSLMK